MANALGVEEQLAVGESRTSDNGQYRLDMQADGNLVLYRTSDNAPLWASQTAGRGGTRAVMQGDERDEALIAGSVRALRA
jgi:hypothetical protein